MAPQHEVVIIGGGNAGVSLAARLKRYGVKDIALIEPKEHHLYQLVLAYRRWPGPGQRSSPKPGVP